MSGSLSSCSDRALSRQGTSSNQAGRLPENAAAGTRARRDPAMLARARRARGRGLRRGAGRRDVEGAARAQLAWNRERPGRRISSPIGPPSLRGYRQYRLAESREGQAYSVAYCANERGGVPHLVAGDATRARMGRRWPTWATSSPIVGPATHSPRDATKRSSTALANS